MSVTGPRAPTPTTSIAYQSAESFAAARATYGVDTPAGYGVDIVADLGASKAASFANPVFGPVEPGLYFQAQRLGQRTQGEFYFPFKPADSLDTEIMGNIKMWGNNAEQLGVFEIRPGLNAWRGGVAGGAGQQVFIPARVQSAFVNQVASETLFIDALKAINRTSR